MGDGFLGWDREYFFINRDGRLLFLIEGEYYDKDLDRRDWRLLGNRYDSRLRLFLLRSERDFGFFRYDRDRLFFFLLGNRDIGFWLD